MRNGGLAALVITCLGSAASASPQNLPELVAARQADVTIRHDASGPAVTLDDTARSTQVVVKGKIGRASSRFTDDHLDIVTTFELDDPEVLLGTMVSHVNRPEALLPFAFVQRGGRVPVEGHFAISQWSHAVDLQPGTEVVVLLARDGNVYRTAPSAIFGLTNGSVAALSPLAGELTQFQGAPLQALLDALEARRRPVK